MPHKATEFVEKFIAEHKRVPTYEEVWDASLVAKLENFSNSEEDLCWDCPLNPECSCETMPPPCAKIVAFK